MEVEAPMQSQGAVAQGTEICSHVHVDIQYIHFFHLLDCQKIIAKQGVHDRLLKE